MLTIRHSRIFHRNFCTNNASFDSQKLLKAISDLGKHGIKLPNFPTLVLFGPQSSGKSSVVQSIVGDYILPTNNGLATRKPTIISTFKSNKVTFKVADREFLNSRDAATEIDSLNRNSHVKEIRIEVSGANLHNSTFIDLPGLFVVSDDSNDSFRKQVKELATKYASNPNIIPIIVHAAPSDPATNAAIKLLSKHDRRLDSFGVLTKLDMVKHQKTSYLEKMLDGTEYKIGHSYCAVVLPTDTDIEKGVSVEDKIKFEADFFKRYPHIKPAGIPTLRKMISDIQAKKILEQIPSMISDVDVQIASLKSSNKFLDHLVSGQEETLSRDLRILVEKVVNSSQDRAIFESELKTILRTEIKVLLEESLNISKGNKIAQATSTNIEDQLIHYHQRQYHEKNFIRDYYNRFKDLFSFGAGSPIFIDNKNLAEAYEVEKRIGTLMPFVDPQINDNLGIKRKNWNQQLNNFFSKLLKDNAIHKIIQDSTMKLLLEYVRSDTECDDEMTKQFAEYMITDISNEAFAAKIKDTITAMINLEKRPSVSAFELMRHFIQTHPHFTTIPATFFTPNIKKVKFEIFGEDWIAAYSSNVIENIAETAYRNIAVNLLTEITGKLMTKTIGMSYKKNVDNLQSELNSKLKALMDIRQILVDSQKN